MTYEDICKQKCDIEKLIDRIESDGWLDIEMLRRFGMEQSAALAAKDAEIERLKTELHQREESNDATSVLGPIFTKEIDSLEAKLVDAQRRLKQAREIAEGGRHDMMCRMLATKYDPDDRSEYPGLINCGMPCSCWKSRLLAALSDEPKAGGTASEVIGTLGFDNYVVSSELNAPKPAASIREPHVWPPDPSKPYVPGSLADEVL